VKKVIILVLVCIMAMGCSKEKKEKVVTAPGQAEDTAVVAQERVPINTGAGISVKNGTITTKYSVVEINNRIMGVEDDFFTTEPIKECDIVDSFNGITIALPDTIENKEVITVELSYDDKVFSGDYNLNGFTLDGSLLGYTVYVSIENKYWINPEGKWNVKIVNNKKAIFEKAYEAQLLEILYEDLSDSPLDRIQVREIAKNTDYTYRFFSKDESIVVLYYTEDDIGFYPVMVIEVQSTDPDKNVVFRWGDDSINGHYYINHYSVKDIPTKVETMALFDSYYLK